MSLIHKELGNRYFIEERVGIGGMAVVYKAKDRVLNRYVAVKVLKDEYMEDDDFLKKFAMEAQSAASIGHTNIVSVYDVGSSTIDDKKYNYIVMEYVDGKTLKDIINKEAPLETERIIDFGYQIAEALDCAHQNNIIHRDIKPQNMLIDKYDHLKVTDFGIARIATSSTITYTSTVLGTVHYISPEQAKGKFIDEKSDIYSLGVVLYEMATGRVPFDASNAVGIALKHIQDDLIEPIEYNVELPKGLNDIIVKALSKDPLNRFYSASEVKDALNDYENFRFTSPDEEKTAKIGIAKVEEEEIIPKEKNTDLVEEKEAVYTIAPDEEEEEKKPGFFMRNVLPIFLALLVVLLAFYTRSYFKGRNADEDVIETVAVPAVIELKEDEARRILRENNLEVEIEYIENSDAEEGYVVSQDPTQNTMVEVGDTVTLEVSKGKEEIIVPNLTDMTQVEADVTLRNNNLSIGEVVEEESDRYAPGKIIHQIPRYGSVVYANQKIDIVIAKEVEDKPEEIEVPSVTGKSLSEATKIINSSGLNIGSVSEIFDNQVPRGQVVQQYPAVGKKVKENDSVNLVLSKGPEETEDNRQEQEPAPNTPSNKKTYRFLINQPALEGSYQLTIKKITDRGEETIYDEERSVSEGNVEVTHTDESGARFNIYIDGKLQQSTRGN